LFATANPNWKYAALRRRPADVEFVWIWPPLAHVDPEKQAAEEQTRMASGTLSFDEACAAAGKNPDTQIKKLGEITKKWAAAGLAPPPWMTAGLQKLGLKLNPDGTLALIEGMKPAPPDAQQQ
jgi:capsid protein